jgi:hypothetical protein
MPQTGSYIKVVYVLRRIENRVSGTSPRMPVEVVNMPVFKWGYI